LVHAIQSGAIERTVRLLASGTDLEIRETEENTALHHAVMEENFSAVEILLDLGADVHSANLYGRTALHEAAKISHDAHSNFFSSKRQSRTRRITKEQLR
jgi:ankyrin repeat protein